MVRTLMVSTTILVAAGLAEAQGSQEQGLFRFRERVVTPKRPAAEAALVDQEVRRGINVRVNAQRKALKRNPRRAFAGVNVQSATSTPGDLVQIESQRVEGATNEPESKAGRQRLWLAKRLRGVKGLDAWAERVIAKTHVYAVTAQGRAQVDTLFVSSSEPRVSGDPGPLEEEGRVRVERVADQVALVITHQNAGGALVDSLPIHVSLDELSVLGSDPDKAAGTELGALIRSLHRQTEPSAATFSTLAFHAVHGTRIGQVVGFLPTALLDSERRLGELPFGRTGALLEERRLARVEAARKRAAWEVRQQAELSKAMRAAAPVGGTPALDPRQGAKAALERSSD